MRKSDNTRLSTSAPAHFSRRPIAVAIQTSLLSLSLACASANAADILVTSNLDDNGDGCTLREAIASANTVADLGNGCAIGGESGTDQITFDDGTFAAPNNTITLQNGQIELTDKEVQLNASTISGGVTIDANSASRVMSISGGSVYLNSLTTSGGRLLGDSPDPANFGGGLNVTNGANVTLSDVQVRNNTVNTRGGGIYMAGEQTQVTIIDSVVSSNGALKSQPRGGGIYQNGGTLTLSSSEISENTVSSTSFNSSPGIFSESGVLNLYNSKITRNFEPGATGGTEHSALSIFSTKLTMVDSEVSYNTVGGIFIDGIGDADRIQSTIRRSTISNNIKSAQLAALVVRGFGAELIIEDSTISNNSANVYGPTFIRGGQIVVVDRKARAEFRNTTISNNNAGSNIIGVNYDGSAYFDNVTIADNDVGDFIDPSVFPFIEPSAVIIGALQGGTATFRNSIIANPKIGQECYSSDSPFNPAHVGEVTVDNASIIGSGTCNAVRSGDSGLLPLADNGGATLTHALAPDSIAINTGDANTCLAFDQRGAPRDAQCDVGAFEFGANADSISLSVDANEINENGGNSTGTLTRTGPVDQALTITLQSSDVASATVPSSVQIPAGQASANFAINAIDDLIAQGNQVVTVTASAVDFVDSTADVTIIDDDVATLNLSLARAEAAENSGVVVATLSRNTPIDVDLTVALVSNDVNSATVPASVTIPAGQTSVNVDITLLDTRLAEGDRVINIAATADGLLASNADLTVTDDDVAALTVILVFGAVAENDAPLRTFVTRNTPTTNALTISLSSSDAARLGVPANATFAAGESTASFDITPLDDQIANGDSVVTISASATGLQTGQGEVTVTDNDIAALSLSLSANSTDEGGAVTATLSRNTPNVGSLSVALSNSDAARASLPANVVIAAGENSTTFTVQSTDNGLVDGDALVSVSASAPGLVTGLAEVTVTDDDIPTLVLSVPSTDVAENSGTITATLSRNTPNSTDALDVALSSSDENRVLVPSNVSFTSGALTTSVDLTIVDDAIARGDATVSLSAALEGFVPAEQPLTVRDDEQASLSLSFAQTSVDEAGSVLGTVSRNTPSDTPLTVSLMISEPSVATVSPTIEIPAGANSADIVVSAVDNVQIDLERVVTLTVSDASGELSADDIQLTVTDNDDDDGDTIANNVDNCPSNRNTNQADLDGDGAGDACDADIDGDGMPNTFEQANGLNPRNAADANQDNDGDGFTNLQEFEFGSDPNVADVDENGNGIPDAAEAAKFNVAPILLLLLDDNEMPDPQTGEDTPVDNQE